jgi:hypothetical protein
MRPRHHSSSRKAKGAFNSIRGRSYLRGMESGPQADEISFAVTETLAEVDVASREVRVLVDGDEPLGPTGTPIARIVSLGDVDVTELTADTQADSRAVVRIPHLDLDSDQLYEVRVGVFIGTESVIVLASREPLPRRVALTLIRRVANDLTESADGDIEAVEDVAREMKDLALPILRTRISEIEQSVRDALSDEQLTPSDYAALRDYPARLAIVERLARDIRNPEPSWDSLRPKPDPGLFGRPAIDMDMFWKWAGDVEDEAKRAVERLSGLISSQQVVLVQRQRLDVERFQRVVTLVGAAVLVPGLVAGIFGANVDLPGGGTSTAFWAMLLLMAAGGVGSYVLLRSIELGYWAGLAQRRPFRASAGARALTLGLAAVALAVGGFVLLSRA